MQSPWRMWPHGSWEGGGSEGPGGADECADECGGAAGMRAENGSTRAEMRACCSPYTRPEPSAGRIRFWRLADGSPKQDEQEFQPGGGIENVKRMFVGQVKDRRGIIQRARCVWT